MRACEQMENKSKFGGLKNTGRKESAYESYFNLVGCSDYTIHSISSIKFHKIILIALIYYLCE